MLKTRLLKEDLRQAAIELALEMQEEDIVRDEMGRGFAVQTVLRRAVYECACGKWPHDISKGTGVCPRCEEELISVYQN